MKEILFNSDGFCMSCGRDIIDKPYGLCKDCFLDAPTMSGRFCGKCLMPMYGAGDYCKRCKGKDLGYDKVASVYVYDGIMRPIVHNFKFNRQIRMAKPLAYAMYKEIVRKNWDVDIIIPVPLSKNRLKERGYNQSELLAKNLSKHMNVPLDVDTLTRIKDTESQRNLDFAERQKNLQGAFVVKNKRSVAGKRVLLIDDVLTTGATSRECAKELKNAGASCVYLLVAVRSVFEQDVEGDDEE